MFAKTDSKYFSLFLYHSAKKHHHLTHTDSRQIEILNFKNRAHTIKERKNLSVSGLDEKISESSASMKATLNLDRNIQTMWSLQRVTIRMRQEILVLTRGNGRCKVKQYQFTQTMQQWPRS